MVAIVRAYITIGFLVKMAKNAQFGVLTVKVLMGMDSLRYTMKHMQPGHGIEIKIQKL